MIEFIALALGAGALFISVMAYLRAGDVAEVETRHSRDYLESLRARGVEVRELRNDLARVADELERSVFPAGLGPFDAMLSTKTVVTLREAVQALYRHLGLTASKQPQGPAQVTVRPLDKLVINKPKRRRR